MFCSMDERKFERHSFEERDPQMPTLGTRVRRGPDWMWKEQDNYGPGTVIAHSNEGIFRYIMCYKNIVDFTYKGLLNCFLSIGGFVKTPP